MGDAKEQVVEMTGDLAISQAARLLWGAEMSTDRQLMACVDALAASWVSMASVLFAKENA